MSPSSPSVVRELFLRLNAVKEVSPVNASVGKTVREHADKSRELSWRMLLKVRGSNPVTPARSNPRKVRLVRFSKVDALRKPKDAPGPSNPLLNSKCLSEEPAGGNRWSGSDVKSEP